MRLAVVFLLLEKGMLIVITLCDIAKIFLLLFGHHDLVIPISMHVKMTEQRQNGSLNIFHFILRGSIHSLKCMQ